LAVGPLREHWHQKSVSPNALTPTPVGTRHLNPPGTFLRMAGAIGIHRLQIDFGPHSALQALCAHMQGGGSAPLHGYFRARSAPQRSGAVSTPMGNSQPGPHPTLKPSRPRPNTDSGITAHPGWVSDRSSYRGQLLLGAGFCWSCLLRMMPRLGPAREAYAHTSTGLATGGFRKPGGNEDALSCALYYACDAPC